MDINKEDDILITVIVPIYNIDEKYLRKCIESLINQTLKNINIILIDDGSEKKVRKICEEYKNKDNRIKLICNELNKGVSVARNIGIKNTNTKYIMFVDGDDWLEKECLKNSVEEAEKNKLDVLAFSYNKIYENGQKEKIKIYKNKVFYRKDDIEEFNYYDMKILGSSCMKIYRKDFIKDQLFNEEIENGEDVEFNYRLFYNLKSIEFLPMNYYNYEIRKNSTVRKFNKNIIKEYVKTLNIMKCEIKSEKQEDAYYSFSAISFLMISLNYIYSKQNKVTYFKKKKEIKCIKKKYFLDLFCNLNKVSLPITRKLPIIFAKYNMYFLFYLIMKIKLLIQNR